MPSMLATLPATADDYAAEAQTVTADQEWSAPLRGGVTVLFIALLFALAAARTLVVSSPDPAHCASGQVGACAAAAMHATQPLQP